MKMETVPSNGIYIILGEINLLLTSLKRTNQKYSASSHYVCIFIQTCLTIN